MKLQTILTTLTIGVSIFMSGCASKNIAATNSGFFQDYKEFSKINKEKATLSKYTNIIVSPVEIISYIPKAEQTLEQKRLYQEISEYLNAEYKLLIDDNHKYKLVDKKSANTLIFESAISTVEVHADDKKWNPHAPIPMGLNVVSFNPYMDEDVRLLGEKRLVDALTGQTLTNSMNIQESIKIMIDGDTLTFKELQPALDSWLEQIQKDLK